MGYETKCRARVTDAAGVVREADATVLLETDELIVRGEARIKIPRTAIQRATVRAGVLTVTAPQGVVTHVARRRLGAEVAEEDSGAAEALDRQARRQTRSAKVWLIGIDDETLIAQIAERTTNVSRGRQRDGVRRRVRRRRDARRISTASAAR